MERVRGRKGEREEMREGAGGVKKRRDSGGGIARSKKGERCESEDNTQPSEGAGTEES